MDQSVLGKFVAAIIDRYKPLKGHRFAINPGEMIVYVALKKQNTDTPLLSFIFHHEYVAVCALTKGIKFFENIKHRKTTTGLQLTKLHYSDLNFINHLDEILSGFVQIKEEQPC